jgi:hypothetical protein
VQKTPLPADETERFKLLYNLKIPDTANEQVLMT